MSTARDKIYIAALNNIDRMLAAGEISQDEYAVMRAQLLAAVSQTRHRKRMGVFSTILLWLLISGAIVMWFVFAVLSVMAQ